MNADAPPMNADESGSKRDMKVKSHEVDCIAALNPSFKHSAFIGGASAFIGVSKAFHQT